MAMAKKEIHNGVPKGNSLLADNVKIVELIIKRDLYSNYTLLATLRCYLAKLGDHPMIYLI